MDIPTPAELVEKIEAFIARHGMAETRFGRDAVRDPNMLSDLRAGQRLPGLTKLNRIAAFMRDKDAEAGFGEVDDHAASDTPGDDAASCGEIVKKSAQQVAA